MALDFDVSRTVAPPVLDPIDDVLALFRKGSALVDHAVLALAAMAPILSPLKPIETSGKRVEVVETLLSLIESASVEGDNLLVARKPSLEDRPFVIFALARQAGGTLAVHSIEIDRRAVVLSEVEGDGRLPFDQMKAAARSREGTPDAATALAFQATTDTLRTHVASAMSRLSIVKARLDMQSSFLTAVVDADSGSPKTRLDSHLNLQGAREMALMTRTLLSRQPLNIGNNNRKTLRTLFEHHASSTK